MKKLPQLLLNVRVGDREALPRAAAVWEAVKREESGLEGRGRVLLRPSGTEPVVRVMAEAPTEEEARLVCERLAEVVSRELS
jgi:phosphoglucosamine mutase